MTSWSVFFIRVHEGLHKDKKPQLQYYNQRHCMIVVLCWHQHIDIEGMLNWEGMSAAACNHVFSLSPEGHWGWHMECQDKRDKRHGGDDIIWVSGPSGSWGQPISCHALKIHKPNNPLDLLEVRFLTLAMEDIQTLKYLVGVEWTQTLFSWGWGPWKLTLTWQYKTLILKVSNEHILLVIFR